MLGQTSIPEEKASLSFKVGTVVTGLGLAALLLIGVSVAHTPVSTKPSNDAAAVAVISPQDDAFIPLSPLPQIRAGLNGPATNLRPQQPYAVGAAPKRVPLRSAVVPSMSAWDGFQPRPEWSQAKVKFYRFIKQAAEGWQWEREGSAGVLAGVAAKAMPIIAAGVLTSFSQGAYAADADAGAKIFSANCAACHAGGQNSVSPKNTLEKEALEKYLDGGMNEAAVMKQVTNGKNAMPAFNGKLSEDDIANVASYVVTTANEGWD